MPPKKKKGGKGGKKKGGKGESTVDDNRVSELERESYKLRIEDLESKLERRQKICDTLEKSNEQYQHHYEKEVHDKEDLVEFLKRALQERAVEVTELQDKLIGLQHAHNIEKENYEKQIAALKSEFNETQDNLMAENMMLSGKLAMLEEFRLQKESILSRLEELQRELAEQEKKYKEQVHDIEQKAILDNEKLKKEMVERVEDVANEFRKVSDKQLSHTIKQTINETVRVNLHLKKTSEMALHLSETNLKMKTTDMHLRQQLQIREAIENELSSKVQGQQKVIALLQDKCAKQQNMLQSAESVHKERDVFHEVITQLKQQMIDAQDEIHHLAEEKIELNEQLKGLEKELMKYVEKNSNLMSVVKTSEEIIKREIMTLPLSKEEIEDMEEEDMPRRDKLLQQILALLDAAIRLDSEEVSMIVENLIDQTLQSDSKRKQEAFIPYHPGNLGLIQGSFSTSSKSLPVIWSKEGVQEAGVQTEEFNIIEWEDRRKVFDITAATILKDIGLLNKFEKHKIELNKS